MSMTLEQADREHLRLYQALRGLEAAATEVARCGAQSGRQWSHLAAALIKARVAIDTAKPLIDPPPQAPITADEIPF